MCDLEIVLKVIRSLLKNCSKYNIVKEVEVILIYSMIDILDSLMNIEKKAITIYETIVNNSNADRKLISSARILILEEKRHIESYQKMMEDMKTQEGIEFDLGTYNEISAIYYDTMKELKTLSVKTIPQLLAYAMELEKLNVKLLMKIQRVLGQTKLSKSYKVCYDFISNLIEIEKGHINNLLAFTNHTTT